MRWIGMSRKRKANKKIWKIKQKEEFDKTINGMNDRANSITKFTSVR